MTLNLHYHLTGSQMVVAVLFELAWLGFVVFIGRKWWIRRHRPEEESE